MEREVQQHDFQVQTKFKKIESFKQRLDFLNLHIFCLLETVSTSFF